MAAGDRDAFTVVVEHTQARLFRLSARLVGDAAEAEDVLQEAYLKAFRGLSEGDVPAEIEAWLYRVVTNGALDALRRRAVRRAVPDPEPALGALPAVNATEAHAALAELNAWLADLPPEQRAALVLSALEGASNAEAARALGVSVGALEQLLVRARATLRKRRDRHD